MGKKNGKNKKRRQRHVLADHQRKGKTFLPPFLAMMGDKLAYVRWIDDLLPNMLWISLLIEKLSIRRGVEVAMKCAQETNRIVAPEKARSFAIVSDYQGIDAEQAQKIRETLNEEGVLDELQSSLISLVSLHSECPLSILFDDRARDRHRVDLETSLNTLKRVIRSCFDRRDRPAMMVQATVIFIMMATGKLIIPRESAIEDLNEIVGYPNTEESKKVAAFVRAGLNAMSLDREGRGWCTYFWGHGYEISVCELPQSSPSRSQDIDDQSLKEVRDATLRYRNELFKEVRDHWNKIPLDLAHPLRDEILGGLIARQARLATAVVGDPNLWAVDVGRILLRCMVDTHITFVWLATRGTDQDFERFFEHGLGQEKLLLEHLISNVEKADKGSESLQKQIDVMRAWINSQRSTDFLPVKIGSWTDKSTRDMAEEAGCLKIYNLSFTPFSSVVHGMWNEIAMTNLEFCANPLHRFHRVPFLVEPPMYLGIADHAAQLMDESFRAWESARVVHPLEATASGRLREGLKKFVDSR